MADALRTKTSPPKAVFLKDYTPPDFRVEHVYLRFQLDEDVTIVAADLSITRRGDHQRPLVLDGDASLELTALKIDGQALDDRAFQRKSDCLIIPDTPERFTLNSTVRIRPQDNTRLEGLYKSGGNFCTQCEAEGFRNITYYLDRPDVMAPFSVRIEADRARYPVLLSNGNPVETGALDDGRHYAVWDDPFPKPAYLFALVAGDLDCLSDHFRTRSGRDVTLNIYAEKDDIPRCGHAMESLKRAMRWDEEVYGLEYDLEIYNIVAVSDFNMGAMENKSLNLFNTRYVLADEEVATDQDFDNVEGVIAHEYFHNWTGNRVTCRDWFQLSLKEGLTVFRDQQFSADMGSPALKRIEGIRALRNVQFAEDAGPLAHPVRPESYIEINNFYTSTVYNKGAEVIRMMHTLIGPHDFRAGIDLYFERHDGQAVTCDDFAAAMEDASGVDLGQFKLWYSQAGTPKVTLTQAYDEKAGEYRLSFEQSVPATPGQLDKKAMHIPIRLGLIGPNGSEMSAELQGDGHPLGDGFLLNLRDRKQTFIFRGVGAKPIPSLFRDFSAPVRLESDLTRADLLFLLAHDNDPFARWEAGRTVALDILTGLVEDAAAGRDFQMDAEYAEALQALLADGDADRALRAEAITLPSETVIAQNIEMVDVDDVHLARKWLARALGERLWTELEGIHEELSDRGRYEWTPVESGARRLKNAALSLMMATEREAAYKAASSQFHRADNMTDRYAALVKLAGSDSDDRDEAIQSFYDRHYQNALALDKWFTAQAVSPRDDAVECVVELMKHRDFSLQNPNRLRALVGAFSAVNQVRFHSRDGRGYRILVDTIKELDELNPQLAARMLIPMGRWRRYDAERQILMQAGLRRLLDKQGLSPDVYEIASKSLEV